LPRLVIELHALAGHSYRQVNLLHEKARRVCHILPKKEGTQCSNMTLPTSSPRSASPF
jgi:hypothetical protein